MKLTSSMVAKMLRQLNDEMNTLRVREENTKSFVAALSEDPESVRPEYDYAETQKQITETDAKIRKLKHALNIFNTTTVIPEFNMTIDEMLVYLPQLSRRAAKLSVMKDELPKKRENSSYSHSGSSIIDYRYANYDIKQAADDYAAVSEELAKAQTALDYINSTAEFDFEF